ncbi:glycosyltransferase [Daejeonella oryzae]|uniref:glycosyltransferase n=1 Tax=Daejeonella oryzae TaxID=1122943 RepID=UPI00047AA2C3|nr:glycosyltransferase [Daejeonella oryzae]
MINNRILILLPNDTLGGAEQVLKQIGKYYSQHNYIVDVFFLKKKKENNWEGIGENVNLFYTKADREKYGVLQLLVQLKKHATKYNYEFAYTSHAHTSGLIGFLRNLNFLKINNFIARESTSVHDRFTGIRLRRFKMVYRMGYLSTDLLICQTNYMKLQLFKILPKFFPKLKRIEVIPNPISLQDANLTINETAPHSTNYLVAAGRLIEEKGFDLLIQSFYNISEQYPFLDLIILGEGPKRMELESLIITLGLQGRVFLKGFQKDVYNYFKHAKVCVVSSRIEGFPNVLLQMMSQNDKVVSTLCAGDIDKIKGVFTCSPNNVSELQQSIQTALNNTEDFSLLFDQQLHERDINHFIHKIHSYLGITKKGDLAETLN